LTNDVLDSFGWKGLSMYLAAIDRYQLMSYARCGRSGLRFPRISLGLWQNFGKDASFENDLNIWAPRGVDGR
jgi:hypothetical protein